MEQRYMKVRKQLDDLGYMQILIPESIPLVEKLTLDLIQTTESLQKYKTIAKDALEERNNLQFGAEPYKCDNAKLVKECNDLHLAFLQVREQNDRLQRDLKRRLSKLEKEKLESSSECEKLKRQIRDLELESARKTDRILTLQNKSFQAGGKSSAKSASTFVSKSRSSVTSKSNVEMCSTVPKADQKLTELTNEIKKLKDEQLQLYETNESYQKQINNRDREIERLTKMLEGGRPLMALNKDCCYKDIEINMCRLQSQMRSLEKEKNNLETRLKESLSKQHEAMERALQLAQRNKQLEQELREIDEMALTVETDCNSTIRNNLEKVQKLQAKLHEMSLQMQTLERDVGDLKREKQELLSDLDAHKLEKQHLQSVLETALEDKKRLNDRINQLTIIEHDLNLEIDRLVQTSTNQKRKIAELECKIVTEKFDAVSDRSGIFGPSLDHYKSERDYYMKEYQRLMEQMKNTIEPDCEHVADLVRRIKEKEEQMATLQHENKILAQEKHNLMTRLETVRDCTEDYNSLSLKGVIKKAEREREVLKGDLIRLEEERDALRHRLKMTTESQVDEHARMKKSVNEAEEQVRRLEQERRDLLQNQGSQRASISCLEGQCASLKDQLRISQNELAHQTTLYNQLKALHDQTDKALGDSQGQLNQVEVELCNCQDRIRKMEKDRGGADQEVADLRNEVSSLKGKLAQIDGEKDALLISLDDKTERIAALDQELLVKFNTIVTLEDNLAELKKMLNITEGYSKSKEDLLKNSETDRISLRQDLDVAMLAKESAILENRRLQNEWSAMSAECRRLTGELDQAKQQIEDLKRQLQHYVAEVKRFEDLMEKKESERNELLDQFKSLSQEAVLLENNNHSLENEATQSKVQLSVTLDHVTDLEHKLITQDNMLADYEKQIADLTSQIANMESQICRCQEQQHRTDADLSSVRDLCVKLDKQKDSLMHELHEKENERSQTNVDLAIMRQEFNNLQDATVRDRNTIENLEKLLADSREEAVQLKLAKQDLEAEITKVKQKLEELQKRVTGLSEQLDFYQERALDYSQQNKQLRRDIANERFFRTKEEEGKRYPSLFPPLTAACTYSTCPKSNCSKMSVGKMSSPANERSKIQLEIDAHRRAESGSEKCIHSILPENRSTITPQCGCKNCTCPTSCATTSNRQNLSKPSSVNSGSFKSTLTSSNRVQICTPDNCPKLNPVQSPSLKKYSHRTT